MKLLVQYCLAVSLFSFATPFRAQAENSPSIDRLLPDSTSAILEPPISAATEVAIVGEPISSGNVVVRGDYLDPPYRISILGRNVFVNDQRIASLPNEPNTAGHVKGNEFVAKLERSLFWDSTLIVFDDRTRLVVDSNDADYFWESMLNATTIEQQVKIVFEQADYDELSKDCIPTSQWRAALESFHPTASLVYCFGAKSRDEGLVTSSTDDASTPADAGVFDGVFDGLFELVSLNRYGLDSFRFDRMGLDWIGLNCIGLDWFMYVLNTSGMLLAVVSLGVLITNPPEANATWVETLQSPDAIRLVKRCLTLIVVLSLFDLVSTLTAESSGGFAEANPLAEFLIADFPLLTSVKLLVTCMTTGLLWTQREYVGVQLASWWICFVLTLVTIRWVVVDSLFYV